MKKLWERLKSGQPFFIAEAGVNHLGSLELGERLIREAAKAGAHAIKFQSYKAKNLTTRDAPRFWDWDGEEDSEGTQFDSYSILDSFGEQQHLELKKMCDQYNIEFMSTPFDNEAADYLDRVGINAYKIASCDVTNHPLLRHVASKGKIVMLSTGASTIEEIKEAVDVLKTGTARIVVMHCNLKYPTPDNEINLNMIKHLQKEFPDCLIGLSDHTMNLMTPSFAYILGANICEKHYTVDKTLGQSADHWLSVDPDDIKKIIESYDLASNMLGSGKKECTVGEERARLYARRSIVANRKIKKGEILNKHNLSCKRPGTGILPKFLNDIIGKKACRELSEDTILAFEDFE